MNQPLMPKATAVWLVDNTSLTFEQIAAFCGMHTLEIKGIADGDVAGGIQGVSPINNGQLTREEITRCEQDENAKLNMRKQNIPQPVRRAKGPRYTPVAKRQDKPDAVAWIFKNHPYVRDSQIVKLIGTTKNTINMVRDRSHWNMQNIEPHDPVLLGLCSQSDLDATIQRARKQAEKEKKAQEPKDAETLEHAEASE